eukprot:15484821-Alexandrium_andersonii.AAC.1
MMFVRPHGCEDEQIDQWDIYIHREPCATRRARQMAAKQEVLRRLQKQTRVIFELVQKFHDWEEWHVHHQRRACKA